MTQQNQEANKPARPKPVLLIVFLVLAIAGVAMVLYGAVTAQQATGGETIDAAALALPLGWLVIAVAGLVAVGAAAFTVIRSQKAGNQLLNSINERMLLSEYTRRVGYRKRDRQVLRQAITEDIAEGDYDSALVLATQLGTLYGHQVESEEYRQKITKSREAANLMKIQEAVQAFEKILATANWEAAAGEAGKLQRMYPESPLVEGLGDRVRNAKEDHKHALERQFLQASERDDIDTAMTLLTELDKYLTHEEAEPLRETARGVIGKKRDNLGVQFKMAAHDKDWVLAVRIGEQLIRDFPNTQMANEVRGIIDVLRKRATEQHAARGQAESAY